MLKQSSAALDFSKASFSREVLSEVLVQNIFSAPQVRRLMMFGSETKAEVRKALDSFFNKAGTPSISESALDRITDLYHGSQSFQCGGAYSPFYLLNHYVSSIAKSGTNLPRVSSSKLVDRQVFMTDLATKIFKAASEVAGVCYFGSFARGREKPNDIDLLILFKDNTQLKWVNKYGSQHVPWLGPKSNGLALLLRKSKLLDQYVPKVENRKIVDALDRVFAVIDDYQSPDNPIFQNVVEKIYDDQGKEKIFLINPMIQPYCLDSRDFIPAGGCIWFLNNLDNAEPPAFFIHGGEFNCLNKQI